MAAIKRRRRQRVLIAREGLNDPERLLAHFLREAARKQMEWGVWDCGLWLASWMALWLGIDDPAAELRGSYASAEECASLLGSSSFPRVVGRLARAAGLTATEEPRAGAVAVLRGPEGPVGAIRTPHGWAVLRAGGGLLRVPLTVQVIGAWEPSWSL